MVHAGSGICFPRGFPFFFCWCFSALLIGMFGVKIETVPITIGSVEEYIHLIVFPGLLIDSSLFCGQDGIKGARHRIRV